MRTKICKVCLIEKQVYDFYSRNSPHGDGLRSECKKCNSEKSKKNYQTNKIKKIQSSKNYYEKNKKDILKTRKLNYDPLKKKKYETENKEKISEGYRDYRKKNYQKIQEYKKKYRKDNKEKIAEYHKKYLKNRTEIDIIFRISSNLRSRLRQFIKSKGYKKNSRTFEYIGCSPQQLKEYLESQFTNGINWANYGSYGWHIDHIIPLSTAETLDDLYNLNHYTNLQPLWWDKNISKSNKLIQ